MTKRGTGKGALRLAVTGGGTGGHVYPALAIVSAWQRFVGHEPEVLYLGSSGGIEETLVKREGLPFRGVQAGPLRGKDPLVVFRSTGRLVRGVVESFRVLGKFLPDALLATGGYVSIPVALAARLHGIPIVVYLPDVEPGWAVRALAPLSKRIAVTSEASRGYLPSRKVVVTGYPVRADVRALDKVDARRQLGLQEDLCTLLVLGGSRGAHSINRAVGDNLDQFLEACQVIHIAGTSDEGWLRERASQLSNHLSRRYALYPYLHSEFPSALAAADLALSRAGASVMGEYPAVGLPSVLVPYPYAGSHQDKNAQYLFQEGAALVLRNGQTKSLRDTVIGLLKDTAKLGQMASKARALRRPNAAREIAALLVEIGRQGS